MRDGGVDLSSHMSVVSEKGLALVEKHFGASKKASVKKEAKAPKKKVVAEKAMARKQKKEPIRKESKKLSERKVDVVPEVKRQEAGAAKKDVSQKRVDQKKRPVMRKDTYRRQQGRGFVPERARVAKIEVEKKKALVHRVLGQHLSPHVLNLIFLMIDKNRGGLLADVALRFSQMAWRLMETPGKK